MSRYCVFALAVAMTSVLNIAQAQNRGPNGGVVIKSHGHPIEFVYKSADLTFYIGDDDGSPLPTKGMRARATIQHAGKTTAINLTPSAPNLLVGKAQAPLGSKARVVFSATLHGHTLTARYVAD